MLDYLKGQPIEIIEVGADRSLLIIEVNGIGYEIHIPRRSAREILAGEGEIKIYTHLQIREEQPSLYGFESASERELFRQLLIVNGVGARTALALIGTLGTENLVNAIVTGNTKVLSKTNGVGAKTAERIALELKDKLSRWQPTIDTSLPIDNRPPAGVREEVEITLQALGYTGEEIERAFSTLSKDPLLNTNTNVEEWLKRAINWLG